VSTPSLRRTIGWLGTALGSGSVLGASSVKGTIHASGSTIAFTDADVELDGNTARGALSVRFAGRAKVEATLALAKLDLSPYVEAMRAAVIADGPWLIAPTTLPVADAIEAKLKLTADQILIGALRLGEATITATTANGRAAIDIGNAQFYGGRLDARINAAMAGEVLSVSATAKATAVPARVALSDLASVPVLDGTGTVNVDVQSQGRNWGEFAQASSGTVRFTVADGSLAGIDVEALARMAADPLAEGIVPPTASAKFVKMTGTMSVAGGVLQTENLVAEGDSYSLSVHGWGSLLSGVLDGKATLALSAGGGGVSEVPLTVGGSWWNPQFALDRGRPEEVPGSPPG
jgi:AsmA protein